jgi:hypothetical protein
MRHVRSVAWLVGSVLLAGCSGSKWGFVRNNQPAAPIPTETPTAAQLVDYLNRNARQVTSLECQELDLDCKVRFQAVGLRGRMVAAKPHNFRMTAYVVGNPQVDIGSNDQEFWFWVSKAEPPHLYHCTYQDYATGQVRLPFPFQPDWITEALGMAEYPSAENFQVLVQPNYLDLVQQTVSAQGQRVRKIVRFSRAPSRTQVTDYILQDVNGQEICSAHIDEVQYVGAAVVPRRVRLVWPQEQMQLKMKLDEVAINRPLDNGRAAALFTRPNLTNVQSFDLARGLDATSSQLQRTRGSMR